MAKGETKKTNQMQDQQIAAQTQAQNLMNQQVQNRSGVAEGRTDEMYNTMFGGLKDFATGGQDFKGNAGTPGSGGVGGVSPAGNQKLADTEAAFREFMKSGGVDPNAMNKGNATFEELMKSGGWDPEARARMNGFITNYEDLAKTGGYDAEMLNRARGGGVFDEFAKTGGYSDKNLADIRARSNSTIPAFYAAARDEAARASAASGGYGPGRLAALTRMSRDQSRAAADQTRNTEIDLREKVNAGRQWGSGSMATAEDAIARNMAATKLAANQGGAGALRDMNQSISSTRLGAATGLNEGDRAIQKMIQEGKMYGTSGLESQGEADRAAAMSAASAAAANDRWLAEFNREGREYGLNQMLDLYGTTPAMEMGYLNAGTQGNAAYGSTINSGIGNRYDYNKGTDWGGMISGIAGAAAGGLTGGIGLGTKKKTQ